MGLEAVAFPRECVLLLGNEQNGVPAPLLDFVDVCVEVRSGACMSSFDAP